MLMRNWTTNGVAIVAVLWGAGGYGDATRGSAGSGTQWGCGAAVGREERRCGMAKCGQSDQGMCD